MSWVGVKMQQARRQREAVEAIEKLGGRVEYDYQRPPKTVAEWIRNADKPQGLAELRRILGTVDKPPGPALLRLILGDDFFREVVSVNLFGAQVRDVDLKCLERFGQLRWLSLGGTQVTDAGLKHLERLAQLQHLEFDGTQVTGKGIQEHLKGLSQLNYLSIKNIQFTDVDLECLNGLTQLHDLELDGTQVSDDGVDRLHKLLPNCTICQVFAHYSF